MSISSYFQPGRFGLSYELFPPKTAKGEQVLFGHLRDLMRFKPDFVTCTYGAGGSTREKTLDICCKVKSEFNIPVASHLTVVDSTREELIDFLNEARSRDIDYLVALRGDPPQGATEFQAAEGGLRYANELVELVREQSLPFGIAVAGYPETHQECLSPDLDLVNLKRKVDAGADIVITQLFYDNADYFRFVERCQSVGIHIPIVPGVLPVTDLGQIRRLTAMCGARLPEVLVNKLAERDDAEWQFAQGIEFAIRQVQGLIDEGVPGLHFYVLNKSKATLRVLDSVKLPASWTSVKTV